MKSECPSMEGGQQKFSLHEEDIMEKEQNDAELDKKIKALKKKNEALMQRHREIEEDRLHAEKDGMAVTSHRPKQDSLNITITKTPNEKRIVTKGRRSSDSTEQRLTLRMGNEMQLCVSVDSKVEGMRTIGKKIDQDVVYLTSKTKLSMEDVNNAFGTGPHMQIAISRQKISAIPKVERRIQKNKTKRKTEQNKEPGEKGEVSRSDYSLTTSAMEHNQYLQWKKQREQVDHERLARQKDSKGEWRRAWDKGKTDELFEGDMCYVETAPSAFVGRRGPWRRKMHSRENVIENKGKEKQPCNEKTFKMMTTSSRAKGKDRLTSRAQRWYGIEDGDLPDDGPIKKSLDDKVIVKHLEGKFKEDEFLSTEKLKVPVQNYSLGNKEKIVFANEKLLLESKQDVPFHGKKMEEMSSDVPSEGREMIEYLSMLSSDSESGENSANLHRKQRCSSSY
ncbi:coiled-coil domain-containing protein 9B isoform X1 [Bufo bufo]|uniref:coiled-coil domain-containing protein 9B isoform X1 n=1 Tax=Bufo bufo TaxID=8384 RepID=UPI001ABE3B31|nr:coiled-coil domain-containing protein 9B isoform X1 [Bufo bufo]